MQKVLPGSADGRNKRTTQPRTKCGVFVRQKKVEKFLKNVLTF